MSAATVGSLNQEDADSAAAVSPAENAVLMPLT
jgi:hypothetical protein